MRCLPLLLLLPLACTEETRPELGPVVETLIGAGSVEGRCADVCPMAAQAVAEVCATDAPGGCGEACAGKGEVSVPNVDEVRQRAWDDPSFCSSFGGEAPPLPDAFVGDDGVVVRPDAGMDARVQPRDAEPDLGVQPPCEWLRSQACLDIVLEELEDLPGAREACIAAYEDRGLDDECGPDRCPLNLEECCPYTPGQRVCDGI